MPWAPAPDSAGRHLIALDLAVCDGDEATPQDALAEYTADTRQFGKILEQLAKTITVQSEVPLVLE